jgi:hypothetical protein
MLRPFLAKDSIRGVTLLLKDLILTLSLSLVRIVGMGAPPSADARSVLARAAANSASARFRARLMTASAVSSIALSSSV